MYRGIYERTKHSSLPILASSTNCLGIHLMLHVLWMLMSVGLLLLTASSGWKSFISDMRCSNTHGLAGLMKQKNRFWHVNENFPLSEIPVDISLIALDRRPPGVLPESEEYWLKFCYKGGCIISYNSLALANFRSFICFSS